MRTSLTLIASLLLSWCAIGQTTPYYDALILKGYVTPRGFIAPQTEKGIDSLNRILNYYGYKNRQNPFLDKFISEGYGSSETKTPTNNQNDETRAQGTQYQLPTHIRSLDVTTLADGMAKFIVTRTKQELNIAFFYKFQEEMKDPKYADLRSLFPQTYQALSAIGSEIYNYEGYLQTLRQCFISDLNALPNNLPDIIENHREFFEKYPEMESYLRSGCYIAGELHNKTHPGDILKNFPLNNVESLSKNSQGSLKTLMLISASLQRYPIDEKQYWINLDSLKLLVTYNYP